MPDVIPLSELPSLKEEIIERVFRGKDQASAENQYYDTLIPQQYQANSNGSLGNYIIFYMEPHDYINTEYSYMSY